MSAFLPAGKGVVKVVVATNSAESSITLPDVDNVICLGSCKQVYSRGDVSPQRRRCFFCSRTLKPKHDEKLYFSCKLEDFVEIGLLRYVLLYLLVCIRSW